MRRPAPLPTTIFLALCTVLALLPASAQQRPLDWSDLMAFRAIQGETMSANGAALAYVARPDRGDPEVVVFALGGQQGAMRERLRDTTRYAFPFADGVKLGADGRYAAFHLHMPVAVREATEAGEREEPSAVVLELRSGETTEFERTESFAFSGDGRFLALHHHEAEEGDTLAAEGQRLTLRHLETGASTDLEGATAFAFDETGRYLAVVTTDTAGATLHAFDLLENGPAREVIARADSGTFAHLAWAPEDAAPALAFVRASLGKDSDDSDDSEAEEDGALWLWEPGQDATREVVTASAAPEGWHISARRGGIAFTDDGERLLFPIRPDAPEEAEEPDSAAKVAGYLDPEAILDAREMDVWSWNDTRISPRQKRLYESAQRAAYTAAYHRSGEYEGVTVFVDDAEMSRVGTPQNPHRMLMSTSASYGPDETYDGFYQDLVLVDLVTGEETVVAERLRNASARLSPQGRYVLYYEGGHWHAYDAEAATTRTLTGGMTNFADETWDYPSQVPGYGSYGFVASEGGEATHALVYDRYDIWALPLGGGEALNWTGGEGRAEKRQYRIVRTDPDERFVSFGDRVLLEGYHDREKTDAFYAATVSASPTALTMLTGGDYRYRFVMQPDDAQRYVYVRERYDEFPDLWMASTDFGTQHKITRANPQMDELAWGRSELVEWSDVDGDTLQGVVILPPGYDETKRYPVLVYYYRFFSQRLHEFNRPQINHRPSFPLYSSAGYVVFLPDVTFEIGRPGFSATKSVVPGVQKLVDLGIADPARIGLHGHSWSGYQTAFVVTQTDMFAAAVAGAPVTNMTSAYVGIRYASGLARMFQYEQTQSRLGASLWEDRDRYIDNSPLFFADEIRTPLLMMFGDDDGAVPWTEGIQLYLALRRLDRPAWLLQYRGEGHHLRQYGNKLDYAMRMKQFFDHYLMDAPAPAWMTEGEPYDGD
jgi:dipeptidyl aminopeptidase/acylaminoacyl peptidase